MVFPHVGTVPEQSDSVFYGLADIGVSKCRRHRTGVAEEVRDDTVEPVRFLQNDVHQAGLEGLGRCVRFEHLDRTAHRAERITYLVRETRGNAADGGKTIFSAYALLHRADLGEVLESDDKAGGFVLLREKQRHAVTDTDCKTFRR